MELQLIGVWGLRPQSQTMGVQGRALMIAAPRSGSGKTLVTLAILAGLRRRGMKLRAAKAGPDYIDPGFHAACLGEPCINLDDWAMPAGLIRSLVEAVPTNALLLIEAAMGLFDGVATPDGVRGRAADLAAQLAVPVLLVLDISGQSQSAAAVARGFALHQPDVRIAGVILNRAASARHREGATRAIEETGLPVLGCLMRNPELALPERHLGLVQAREHGALDRLFEHLAAVAEQGLDLDRITALAGPIAASPPDGSLAAALPPPGQRIALADDAAFSFVYPHLLQGWREQGAEIVSFSPLADEAPPVDCDCCWLPGGYPELHAGCLAGSTRFLPGLRAFAANRPVHGECGGHMVLGETIEDASCFTHRMAGLLGHSTSFARRKMVLGYREARLLEDCALGPRNTVLRGHEFHYASVIEAGGDRRLAALSDAGGNDIGEAGGVRGRVSGSFFHTIAARLGS